jgi:glycosyltransferase involved in cell wall biosynthesis
MKALKIAIISPLVMGIDQNPNTYSSQQINLALCWADAGHYVDIITGRQNGLAEAISHNRIRLYQHRLVWIGGKGGFPLLCAGLRHFLQNQYDMVLASEHYQISTLLACLISKNTVIYQGQNSAGSTKARRAMMRILDSTITPIVRRRYRKIISKTRSAEAFVRRRGFKKCATIPCGYDTTRFRYPSESERRRSRYSLHLSEEDKVLVYAGNLLPRRDVVTAIRAVAKLHNNNKSVHLLIAGDGPECLPLMKLSSSLGIQSAVHFLGKLHWRVLRDVYWAGDVFVFPTRYEIFGMVLVEALASGLKIVSTPCPAAEDIIAAVPSAGKIIPVGNFQRMADACAGFLKCHQVEFPADNALEVFLEKMTWCSIARRMLQCI